MAENLIIVESPSKAKTITRFLNKDFTVRSSLGHVKDLPTKELGVDIENGFQPTYRIIKGKKKILDSLKKLAKDTNVVYLASDPDREGEAIAWHIAEELKEVNPSIKRLEFHEITPYAIKKSLENPRDINRNLVISQQARRVLDRLVGYLVSPLLWEKVKSGLSAGRVQTVALRLLCEREEEIEEFVPEEYWIIEAILEAKEGVFSAFLARKGKKEIKVKDRKEAERIEREVKESNFKVEKVELKEVKRYPPPPLITSSLQQLAFARYRYTPYRSMKIAQELYEGVKIKEGRVGLITYMRTDSYRISPLARKEAYSWIESRLGKEYIPESPIFYKSRRSAQEAHEAIRPTKVSRSPEELKDFLTPEQLNLYTLIWERFLASQCAPSVWEETKVEISSGEYIWEAKGERLLFEGFHRILPVKQDIKTLPPLQKGEELALEEIKLHQKFTQPPPRFTEGSLVKELEEKDIGRPSTYATIIQILKNRDYVRNEKGRLRPTPLGREVAKILVDNFPRIFEVDFTARMEDGLDRIEEGKEEYLHLLTSFYKEFAQRLEEAKHKMENIKEKINALYSQPCPKCGAPMVIKKGKYGEFLACPNFPTCKTTLPLAKKIGIKCPECGGELVERRSKKKKRKFYACINYPQCKFISWKFPDGKRN